MKMFKFTKREHAVSAVERGEIRIGTLHEYRNYDSHGGLIADTNEGVSELIVENDSFRGTADEFAEKTGSGIRGGGLFHTYGGSYKRRVQVPNVYVFCMASDCSDSTVSWAESEGYQSCYEIIDLERFIGSIMRKLKLSDHDPVLEHCEYGSKTIERKFTDGSAKQDLLRALFMKHSKFSIQKELRLAFLPRFPREPIKPEVIQDPAIARSIRMVMPYSLRA